MAWPPACRASATACLKLVANRRDILVPSLVADKRVELTDHAPEETALLEHALSEEEGDGVAACPGAGVRAGGGRS